jgi:hypothetical protein
MVLLNLLFASHCQTSSHRRPSVNSTRLCRIRGLPPSLVMATFDGLIIQWLLAPERVPSGQLIVHTLQRTAILAAVSSESIDAV